jgi:hypothetical protein
MLWMVAVGILLRLTNWAILSSEQAVWTEQEGRGWCGIGSGPVPDFFETPVLAAWVIPALTVSVIWPNRTARLRWVGVFAVGSVLTSWLLLRRPWIITPGAIRLWPDDCLWYIRERLTSSQTRTGVIWDFFWPRTGRQVADLFALVAFLALVTASLARPVPRRSLAIVAIAANVYRFAVWSTLMWSDRYWGIGNPRSRPGLLGAMMPRVSVMEIVQGSVLVGLLIYLLAIVIGIRPSRVCVVETGRV